MLEKDLINKLNEFKEIEPNKDWAHWLLSNILTKSQREVIIKPRVKLVSFSFIHQYQKALASAAFAVLFVSTFAFAQTTLPGNPLYPVKTLTQNARIALSSKDYKSVVRLEIAKARLSDMTKTIDQEQAIALMSQNIQKDLQALPQELKNISNKKIALQVSQKVREQTKDLKNLSNNLLNNNNLNQAIDEAQNKVYGFIFSTEEEINQCPSYLQDKLANLQKYFTDNIQNLVQWPIDDITKVRALLVDIENNIKAGNCLEATAKIDSINQILQIHSLDIKVETLTPEN
ncbi:MAG: DUF5667 domain-containing protein [Candidatus Paceibacterota bacterium]|jgi:cell division protein ZapA (FtsZ GTPase activity inhibitor)